MRIPLLATVLVLALVGCTPSTEVPAPVPTTTTGPEVILDADLVPMSLGVVTADSAAAEAARLGDALADLIEADVIINVSDASQLAPAEDDVAPYYVEYRTYTLDPSVDPLALAQTIAAVMRQSGWADYEESNENGLYLAPLSAGPSDASWFALIGGDASVAGQSVVTFQIASPDIIE